MKRTLSNSNVSKSQTTLGQFWSSKAKVLKQETETKQDDDDDDDDSELLAAMEKFEKSQTSVSNVAKAQTNVEKAQKVQTSKDKPVVKWPISDKPGHDPYCQASISAPSNEEEINFNYADFDRQAGAMWIYPTNYEKRDYQFKIVGAALFQNTLVILPTGLGKTFIAAVVMFNYCRWYPTGKIIFTAPTKPLVAQQMDACAKVMGIRRSEMCEMTGGVNPEERRRLWLEKRVFFLTPQTLNNDLVKSTCPWSKIRCLIIDEAHRALGNHAYCQVVQEISRNGEQFRVLALSATPGNNVDAVQSVLQSLKISHIEMFTDESPDIKKYSHDKIIDKIVVGPNQLMQSIRRCILSILKQPVENLAKLGVIYHKNPESVTCGSIIMTMKRINKDKPQNLNERQYQEAKNALFFAISFYHALDELEKHGLQSVYNFFKKKLTEDKKNGMLHATFRNNTELSQMYTELQNLFDLSQVTAEQRRITSLQVAHPKLAKLRECVVEHFQTFERTKAKPTDQTRVIIFSEKRDSVREITELLEQDKPLVKPMSFIGQASSHAAGQGINQKLQKKVVNDFRLGGYNVLVATSIGEEGLDIGSVDLIICFDALKSPIRLVQRMGRTGRARQGRIVLMMTEGKEERTYYEGEVQQKKILKMIVDGAKSLDLYRQNLRMVPHDIQPVCQEMFVKVTDDVTTGTSKQTDFNTVLQKTKKHENLLKLFRKEKLLSDTEFYSWLRNYQCCETDHLKVSIQNGISKWSNEQRTIQQPTMCSSRTRTFVDFMKNYTTERVYVDFNYTAGAWSVENETILPTSSSATSLSCKPNIPIPFDQMTLKDELLNKQATSPVDILELAEECDRMLNLPVFMDTKIPSPQIEENMIEEHIIEENIIEEHKLDAVGNFDLTIDDLFPASQSAHISPTLQLNEVKSQTKAVFDDDDDDDIGDDELLEAFNRHIQSQTIHDEKPSPVLVLTNRVNTQAQTSTILTDVTLPTFDLEFSFDDFDDEPQSNNALNTSLSETLQTDKVDTPIRPVPSKKRVRRLSAITPDTIERKKWKSAQELGFVSDRKFHRRLASDFLDREVEVEETPSNPISSDEDENDLKQDDENDPFIDDRQVLTQLANVDMTSIYLKSIKSPKVQFQRPPPPQIPIEDIYSQMPNMTMNDDEDDYDENDSFVDDTTQVIDDHHGEVDYDELANILGTQSVRHRPTKVTRRGVRFGRTSATTTPQRNAPRRVCIAQSPV